MQSVTLRTKRLVLDLPVERGATLEPGAYESWDSILGGAR
jgi:hypothetical protein